MYLEQIFYMISDIIWIKSFNKNDEMYINFLITVNRKDIYIEDIQKALQKTIESLSIVCLCLHHTIGANKYLIWLDPLVSKYSLPAEL